MPKPSNLLITTPSNIKYLSNFSGSNGFMLITKSKKYLFTDSRYIQRAQNTIYKNIELIDITKIWSNPVELKQNWQKILKKHQITRLGVEENNLTIARFKKFKKISKLAGKAIKFEDISETIAKQREIKSPEEIKLITKSQRINEKVFLEIKKIILTKSRITEIEIAWQIKELGQKYGANDISFEPIVAFGKNSSSPHHMPGTTKLQKNDIILVDMGMKYQDYCSDMTRTFFKGKPNPKQLEIYNLVLQAQTAGINKIKAGITGAKADHHIREVIDRAGHAANYSHAGGHGIGLDIHESPSLSKNYHEKILANTIITVEPGIYIPGKFGVRIEDMLLVTGTGNKNLTKITKQPL
ncbi:hypothetical protein CVV38_03655 [Candidatus Peregrinibacteria bacterium HGW-Peregrinibacteria-1]|jgi:Xaa-Pro aminopeptidase|nr:MAG: hypothetical protein CVV38_03655 [Candidatus Peregrinibacteria bacterium HGW-Peregrinibacteria-1]